MTWSRRQLVLLALVLALSAALLEVAVLRIARPWVVAGSSMRPSIVPGDRVLVDLWTFRHRDPAPGELVLIRGPIPANSLLIKRCATPPPFVDLRPRPGTWPSEPSLVNPGVWVLGDNTDRSLDSRRFGAVPRDRIVGRVFWRYWPPAAAGAIR